MLWFLLIGLISGGLAVMISHGGGFGIWGNLAIGVIGSFIGGFLFDFIGISAYGTIGSVISSTMGAIILLWVIQIFRIPVPAYKKQ
ncbi:MAG: Transglycosylase-associated protein [Firmicutes bacterium]|nr:Transglycosylase-associated protein [Bacillota bacterium]